MQATLAELAALVGGQIVGDGQLLILGAATLRDAEPGQITLVDKVEKSHLLEDCRAAAVVAPAGFAAPAAAGHPSGRRPWGVRRDRAASSRRRGSCRGSASARWPSSARPPSSARTSTSIPSPPSATTSAIGAGSTIHSGVHIMAGSRIGENVTIFPNAVLYEDTVVGPRCVIHANAVLGAYGFGYGMADGRHVLSAQLGNVVLGADVEIGAGSTIDRGTYGPTVIGEGTKIDDLVMVAHNCRIGRHNMLCSQVGIAGSTTTGDYVVMAGQVGVRDHVHIGDRAVLGAMAGVTNDVPAGSRMIGIPATPEREQKVKQAALSKLPEMRRQLKQLAAGRRGAVEGIAGRGQAAPIKADDPPDDENADGRRAVA